MENEHTPEEDSMIFDPCFGWVTFEEAFLMPGDERTTHE